MGDETKYKVAITLSIAIPVGRFNRASILDRVWQTVESLDMGFENIGYLAENLGFSDNYDNCAVLVTLPGLFERPDLEAITRTATGLCTGLEAVYGHASRVRHRTSRVIATT